jgi:hypothetical protein
MITRHQKTRGRLLSRLGDRGDDAGEYRTSILSVLAGQNGKTPVARRRAAGGSRAFFVDGKYRRSGSPPARATVLCGSGLGGGTVESYPEDIHRRSVSSSFLHRGSVSMSDRHRFARNRRLGQRRWAVTGLSPECHLESSDVSGQRRTPPAPTAPVVVRLDRELAPLTLHRFGASWPLWP